MKSTPGELLFATLWSTFAAFLTAVLGFLAGLFLCHFFLTDEAAVWDGIIVGPCLALVFATVVFVLVFRKILAMMS